METCLDDHHRNNIHIIESNFLPANVTYFYGIF
jgi:hypothetical protein